MSTSVAQLVVSLEANIARFSNDMRAASEVTTSTMKSIESSAALARKALGALGIAFSVTEVFSWAKGIVESAEALNDLAKVTGSSVENLSRLKNQAQVSGV